MISGRLEQPQRRGAGKDADKQIALREPEVGRGRVGISSMRDTSPAMIA
jgi:hypothetical protein